MLLSNNAPFNHTNLNHFCSDSEHLSSRVATKITGEKSSNPLVTIAFEIGKRLF